MALVTLLFTDVEGSTVLWERDASAMSRALRWHDDLTHRVVSVHGGRVVKERGEGDSVFAVFPSAESAIEASLALQRGLSSSRAETGIDLRVRMAVHTGEVEERDGDFYGQTVNRCARVRGVAHGGQVVLTDAALEAVTHLPADTTTLDLGWHLLRGLAGPERLHQLCHPALPANFPPLESVDPGPDNLPGDRGTLVGRDGDVAGVARLLEGDRLVTVVGPGGIGKTRVALSVARALVGRYPAGRWFIDLVGAGGDEPVLGTVATALGVTASGSTSLADVVLDRLRDSAALLVLDNCEHLVQECAAAVDRLLDACPVLHVLATSREPLHVYAEQCWRLGPLAVPAQGRIDLVTARQFAAVELFCDRAGRAAAQVSYDDDDAPIIADLCRRLDGLPLSVELAAARTHTMTLPEIAAALEDRFALLDRGPLPMHGRQRSLEATLSWSYDLLDDEHQRALRSLGTLRGAFDAGTAAAVTGLEPAVARRVVDALVERSLVERNADDVLPYRLLETVREYAYGRLDDPDERRDVRRRYVSAMAVLVDALDVQRQRSPDRMAQLWAALPDLRAALDVAVEDGAEQAALAVAEGVWRGVPDQSEGADALQRALAVPGPDSGRRARILAQYGWLTTELGAPEEGGRLAEEALAMARRVDDPAAASIALNALALVALDANDGAAATRIGTDQLGEAQRSGDGWFVALARTTLGCALDLLGDAEASYREHAAALEGYREFGDTDGVAVTNVNLGEIALSRGDAEGAHRHLLAAADEFEALNYARGRFWAAWGLANLALIAGDTAEAGRRLAEALSLAPQLGSPQRIGGVLLSAATHAAAGGRFEDACVLLGAAEACGLDPVNLPFAYGMPTPAETTARARDDLGEEGAEAALRRGRALTVPNAIAHATKPLVGSTA